MDLKNKFTQDMRDTYIQSVRLGYRPARFLNMLYRNGGVETAKIILSSQDYIQEGIVKLWELEALHLSVEAKVLKEEYASLFTEDEINEAKRRLNKLEYNIKE